MGPYCEFCHTRCFVHFPKNTPQRVLEAYGAATIMATCKKGQEYEKEKTGYCYGDMRDIITHIYEIKETIESIDYDVDSLKDFSNEDVDSIRNRLIDIKNKIDVILADKKYYY